jgi:hypothetical protein
MLIVTWGLSKKMGVLRNGFSFLNTQFWSGDRCRYFVVETTNFVFFKYHKFILLFDFISTEHGIFLLYFFIEFFNK